MRFSHPSLPKPWNIVYTISKITLVISYIAAAVWFLFLALFPSQLFQFDFRNPQASKNTITEPRDAESKLILNGKTPENSSMIFDTAIEQGAYDTANIRLLKTDKSDTLTGGTISVQKSYRAFFYPTENDMPEIPTGTLLKNNDRYFIINQKHELIAFASSAQALQLGFNPEAFVSISDSDMTTIPHGEVWTDTLLYPEGSLFLIDATHYQLLQGTLHPFVSENAFLSRYDANQAIQKNADFLSQYPISEVWLGFQNASLVSFADGVFIIDGEEVRPIGSVLIFESLGFNWDDVMPVSEEEIGIYKRGRIVLQDALHPNGTVFIDEESDQYYLIQNQKKHSMPNNWILRTYLKNKHAITVSEKKASTIASCSIAQEWFFTESSYVCNVPLDTVNPSLGNAFMFSYTPTRSTDIQEMSVQLKSTISPETSHRSLAQIKQRILTRFGYGQ